MKRAWAEPEPSTPRYDFDEIDLDSDSVHASVVRLVGSNARVLELGPATGYMSRALAARGCSVVGIEIDLEMAARAEEFSEKVVVADLDDLNLEAELQGERFDVIVAADVLEHLRDPLSVLRRLRRVLDPGGFFVISVPNVAHGSVRLSLLGGQFQYQEAGLLDATHLRFFTRSSLEQLLDDADLGLAEMQRHELNLDASEVSFDATSIPPELRETLERDPDARTYQYVVKAIPMEQEGMRELQRRLRELPELRAEIARLEEVQGAMAELDKAMAKIGAREGELRRALVEAHDQILRRDEEIEELQTAVAERDGTVAGLHQEMSRLHEEIVRLQVWRDGILASRPMRIIGLLARLPGLKAVQRRRRARYQSSLAERITPS